MMSRTYQTFVWYARLIDMSRDPAVSVLLPVRDAAGTVTACLRSIARQTMTDWECVVVDDGSSDDSATILSAHAKQDERFRITTTPPRGLVPALNTGIEQARGRFISRIDADDLMHRDRLRRQLEALDNAPGLIAVGTHVRFFPRSTLGPGMRDYEAWINAMRCADDIRRDAYIECPVPHPTLTIERDVLQRYKYEDHGWPEDYDLVLRLIAGGQQIGTVPQRLVSWRRLPERLSATSEAYSIERFVACKAHHLARTFLRDTERYLLWGYGHTGRMLAAALGREGKTPAGIVEIHPGRIGNVIRGAPVFHFDELARHARMPVVVSVAGAGPRAEIRDKLSALGFEELRDYVCAA
jgi:glycosyltransferase involved in cell wall biosynthesis